jgi:maleylacetoacetate isomerase
MYNARRFKIDVSAFPKLVEIDAACQQLPAFRAAAPDAVRPS